MSFKEQLVALAQVYIALGEPLPTDLWAALEDEGFIVDELIETFSNERVVAFLYIAEGLVGEEPFGSKLLPHIQILIDTLRTLLD
ncbi:MAG: hypothetical protein KGI54_08440 [Pseudomonadota bacterium]|nr:hypothetical protein [Pseudomonadota bacterium]